MRALLLIFCLIAMTPAFGQDSSTTGAGKLPPNSKELEKEPRFPGGEAAMQKFLMDNFTYPPLAIKNQQEGRVIVDFIVDVNGDLKDIKVMRQVSLMV